MKGVNLKKIGAIVAGATILASSVAFAGLFYQNTELVDANGQPVAKVVLGSGAAPSDGAVAGAIAAKLASAAYKKQTLTASVASDATCTPTASGNATGSCAISNEKVTLEVTVPGMSSTGVHDFVTNIGDYIDRTTENREQLLSTDDLYDQLESETDANANPFSDGIGTLITGGAEPLYKVDGTSFSPFATKTINDASSGDVYTELQNAYVQGTTDYSDSDKAIGFTPQGVTYQIKFDDPNHNGILVCTSDENNNKDWADCGNAPEATSRHRVKISFLGSDWIITELNPAGTTSSSDAVVADGSIKLAKESIYGIVNVGESLTSSDGQLKVRLDDISTAVGSGNEHPAVVSFIDANGNVISQDQVYADTTMKKVIGGKTYRLRVYQTAPGYTFGAKWAEMAMIENELTLTDGDTLDSTTNQDWNVHVLWKNKDASVAEQNVDALRGVLLYKTSNFATDSPLLAGASINVVEDPVAYKLTYQGLNLQSGDYDQLKYTVATSGSVTLADGTSCQFGKNIKITTQVDDGLEYTGTVEVGGSGSQVGKGKEIYYLLADPTATACTALNTGDMLMRKSGENNKYYGFDTDSVDAVGTNPLIKYKTAGSRGTDTEGGAIDIINGGGNDGTPGFDVYEDIGTAYVAGPSEITHAESSMAFWYDGSKFWDWTGTNENQVDTYYDSPYTFLGSFGYDNGNSYERGYISPRGSKFDQSSASSVTFKIAKKLGKAMYEFATTAAAGGNATTQLTLLEGQTGNVGDITIKAKSIDETVGACSASGGAATCTVPKDQLSAVIMPNNAATADVMVPFAVNPKLVVLDTDAASVSTGVLITVGGDQVNSVTAGAMAGAGIDFTATPQVVKVVGNKIVVAGLSASDTVAAGDQFLAALRAQ